MNRFVKALLTASLVFGSLLGSSLQGGNFASPAIKNQQKINNIEKIGVQSVFDPSGYTDVSTFDTGLSITIVSSTSSKTFHSYNFKISSSVNCYVLGSYAENLYYPLTFSYDVTKADSSVETRKAVLPLTSTNNNFNAVGAKLSGSTTYAADADLPINEGETVDVTSLKATNIFYYDADTKTADYNTNYYLGNPKVSYAASKTYDLADFLSYSLSSLADFGSYTSINCSYTSTAKAKYAEVYSSYADHQSKFEDGSEYIRVRLTSVTNCTYRINFKDGTALTQAVLGTSIISLSDSGSLRFLLSGFKADQVESMELLGATLTIDIVNTSTKKTVTSTSRSYRFGSLLFEKEGNVGTANYTLILILSVVLFALAFVGGAYGMYRYRKEKFKNDEFRRVNNKHFLKRSGLALAYLEMAVVEIVVLVGRTTAMNNTMVVFNPFDAWIIIFSVGLIIFSGYYIKYFISLSRSAAERRRTAKLHITAEDMNDDGTVAIKKSK